MMNTPVGKAALQDITLYTTLLEHRRQYIRLSSLDYNTLHHSTIKFVPPIELLEAFEQDYATMQSSMIYGNSPGFSTLLSN
jgi:hypothetical protein